MYRGKYLTPVKIWDPPLAKNSLSAKTVPLFAKMVCLSAEFASLSVKINLSPANKYRRRGQATKKSRRKPGSSNFMGGL